MTFKAPDGNSTILILDAKFTNQGLATEHYLKELTFKYLHRLSSHNGGLGTTIGLLICYPDGSLTSQDSHSVYSFNKGQFQICGQKPKLPFLGATGISLNSNIELQNILAKHSDPHVLGTSEHFEMRASQETHTNRAVARSNQITEFEVSLIEA